MDDKARMHSGLVRTSLVALIAAVCLIGGAANVTAQVGVFSGTVLTDSTEKPLANAEIVFTDLKRSVRSDNSGNFLFSGLPLGKHSVVVRLVGYEPITTMVTLMDAKPLEVDLFLSRAKTVLKNVEVKAAATLFSTRLAEFEERKQMGIGRFLTADVFEQEQGRPLSSFIAQKVPGINVVQSGTGRRWLATSARGISVKSAERSSSFDKVPLACYAQIIVNGVVRYDGSSGQQLVDIDQINSLDIIGLEFYTMATTPLQYNRTRNTSGCGTVIIWTK